MTELDIERERREFEAWYKSEYFSERRRPALLEIWLAAKRAVLGSAEPEKPNFVYLGNGKFERSFAPPAPVSAEPDAYRVEHADGFRTEPRSWQAPWPKRHIPEGGKLIKLYEEATPSTDAKDSDHNRTGYNAEKLQQIGAETMRACQLLPENYYITIWLENGYGGVTLVNPESESQDVEGSDYFGDNIRRAIDIALAGDIAAKEAGK